MVKKKFAITGSPISHSLSPVLHNYWLKKYNIEGEYVLMEESEKNLANIIKKIRNKELDGINVTLPYKQKIIPFLDKLVNDAKNTNSVNTIYLDNDNSVIGENTDVFGIQAAYLKQISHVENKKALVIGAGGVAPSIIFALRKTKISNISIINRTKEKSLFLKKKFNYLSVLEWDNLENEIINFDLIINATSLGLKGKEDFNLNFDLAKVKKSLVFIDTIYNPLETKTLKLLKNADIKTFNGLEMLIYQGQKSFYLWNKINPEIDDSLIELLMSKIK